MYRYQHAYGNKWLKIPVPLLPNSQIDIVFKVDGSLYGFDNLLWPDGIPKGNAEA